MGIGEAGERLRRSTVQVRSGRSGFGSGVIWDASGVVVTNAHVIRGHDVGSGDLKIEFWDGRTARAHLDRRDVRRDLAVLRVDPASLEPAGLESAKLVPAKLVPATLGDSNRVRPGDLVMAVGNPLGFIGALSTGVVHAVGPVTGIGGQDFIQTTARLAPGNSGGPLADAGGNVIGINTAVAAGGLGIAVPGSAVRRLLAAESTPFELGVAVRPVRIPGREGGIALLVLEIAAGSAAEYASLRVGDSLIGAGGKRFRSVEDFQLALEQAENGPLTLQFIRGGAAASRETKKREVTVRAAVAA